MQSHVNALGDVVVTGERGKSFQWILRWEQGVFGSVKDDYQRRNGKIVEKSENSTGRGRMNVMLRFYTIST